MRTKIIKALKNKGYWVGRGNIVNKLPGCHCADDSCRWYINLIGEPITHTDSGYRTRQDAWNYLVELVDLGVIQIDLGGQS